MAQAGYTPISLYHSTTATTVPSASNLTAGELALNIADNDMSMYMENASGVVKLFFNNPAALKYPTTDGTSNQVITTNGLGVLSWSNASVGDVTAAGNNAFTGANTFYNSTGQTFGTATSTQDGIVLAGRAGGSSSYRVTLTPSTLSASRTATLPDGGGNYTLGYLNIPAVADKTTSYSLQTSDIGKVVGVGTGGSITIPNSTFAAGDAVLIFNNTSGNITITCTITTAYIAGTDADKASVTLATRGVANILFISATACVITGNVT